MKTHDSHSRTPGDRILAPPSPPTAVCLPPSLPSPPSLAVSPLPQPSEPSLYVVPTTTSAIFVGGDGHRPACQRWGLRDLRAGKLRWSHTRKVGRQRGCACGTRVVAKVFHGGTMTRGGGSSSLRGSAGSSGRSPLFCHLLPRLARPLRFRAADPTRCRRVTSGLLARLE
jgi:hypothetical protein